jgi:MYXO-CTERM domain-containing protein
MNFLWGVIVAANSLAPAVMMPLRTIAKRFKRFTPMLAAPVALLLIQGKALASTTLVTFPLNNNADGNSGFNYSIIDSSVLTAATIANGPGFGTFSVGTYGLTPDVQVLRTGPSSNTFPVSAADALNNNWYFTIALTPNGSMSINTINLDWSRGGTTGVRGWFVRSNLDNFVSDFYSNQTPDGAAKGLQPVSIDLSSFTGLTTPTEFRFYSYTETTGHYIDFSNISFLQADGPGPASVPGPLPLLGVGAAFGWSRRLRKRIAAPLSTPPQA